MFNFSYNFFIFKLLKNFYRFSKNEKSKSCIEKHIKRVNFSIHLDISNSIQHQIKTSARKMSISNKLSIDQLDLNNKRVLIRFRFFYLLKSRLRKYKHVFFFIIIIRVDFNVPMKGGNITNNQRFLFYLKNIF